MEGQLYVGDIVICINDTATRALSSSAIYKLLESLTSLQVLTTGVQSRLLRISDATRVKQSQTA